MEYTQKIKYAIHTAIRVHELDQKQKRKGKDVPYIIHPLIVGLILARVSSDEDVIVSGILHDAIEDSVDTKKITPTIIKNRFGENVARIVIDVTEKRTNLSWELHKREMLKKLSSFSHDSLLVKAADVIANCTELIVDYKKESDSTFKRFGVSKGIFIQHYIEIIEELVKVWSKNPLRKDLDYHLEEIRGML